MAGISLVAVVVAFLVMVAIGMTAPEPDQEAVCRLTVEPPSATGNDVAESDVVYQAVASCPAEFDVISGQVELQSYGSDGWTPLASTETEQQLDVGDVVLSGSIPFPEYTTTFRTCLTEYRVEGDEQDTQHLKSMDLCSEEQTIGP